jgi:hypothetical protein
MRHWAIYASLEQPGHCTKMTHMRLLWIRYYPLAGVDR